MIQRLGFRLPDRLSVQVSGLYGSLYLHYGLLTFLPLWLSSRQIPPTQIGLLLAIPLFLRLVAVAPVVAWAGRRARLRDALTIFTVLAAGLAASTGLILDHLTLLIVFVLFALAWDQLPVLADAYAVIAVRARNLDFGRLRVWGSLGVVGGSLAGGAVFQIVGIAALPWMAGGLLLLLAGVSRIVPRDRDLSPPDEVRSPGDWKAIFADRQMVGAMIATSLIAGSHGVLTSFAAIQWDAQGWSTSTTGLLMSLGVLSEIVVLWFGQKLLRGADPRWLIRIAAGVAVIRWLAMAFSPPLAVVFGLQLLNAVTAIAPILGMMLIIAKRTPAHLVGVAQGLNAVLLGVGLAVVTLASGALWTQGVGVAYGAMALMATLALPLLLGRSKPVSADTPAPVASEHRTDLDLSKASS